MGAEESERDINCVNWLFFLKKSSNTHTDAKKKNNPQPLLDPTGAFQPLTHPTSLLIG